MKRINSLLSAGVTLTSSGTAVAAPIPLDSAGYFPRFVRVVATGAGCFVKVGDIGVTAVSGDCMIQPLDGTVLNVRGCKAISAISVSGTSSVTVVPLEAGSWNYDQRTLDYNFTTLSAVPSTVTFTRGSSATYFGSDGLLKVQGHNLLTQSTWTGGTSGTEGSGAVAPTSWYFPAGTGSVTFVATAIGNSARFVAATQRPMLGQAVTVTAQTYTVSTKVLATTGTARAVDIVALSPSSATIGAGAFTVNGASVAGTTVVNVNDLVAVTCTVTVGGTAEVRIGIGCNGNFTGDVTLAYPQLEAGSTATQYSPTTTAANSAPRLDYDPATPAGTTGVELVGSTWGGGNSATVTVSGGTVTIQGSGPDFPYAYQQLTGLTIGKTYRVTASFVSAVNGRLRISSIQNGGGDLLSTTEIPSGTFTAYYTATATSGYLNMLISSIVDNSTAVWSNISVQEVTFAPRGLLVEEQRTNNETNGVAFTKSVAGDTVTQNAVGPDGVANSAWTVTSDGTSGVHAAWQASITPAATNTYTVSVFLKAGTQSLVQIATGLAHSSATTYLNINLATQAMTAGAGIVSGSNFCTPIGNGWYRCGFSYVCSAANLAQCVLTYPINSTADTRGPTTAFSTTYYRWGGQYESTTGMGSAPFVTSYIPTTTASATRSADSASMTGTNFSSWYNQTQGTFVVEFDTVQSAPTATRRAIEVNDATDANRMLVGVTTLSNVRYLTTTGGSGNIQADLNQSVSAGGVITAAIAYSNNNFALSADGASPSPDTSGTVPTVDRLMIGYTPSGSANAMLNGHIRRIQYYPTPLPNATLQALTS